MINTLKCPLCEEESMKPVVLKSKNELNDNRTYMWVCEDCPGVLVEWLNDEDTKAIRKYLKGDKSHVKEGE